jgi:DNA-binding transcriptional LysR family regulator
MLPPRVLKPILASNRFAMPRSHTPPAPFPAIECPTLELATKIVAKSDAFTFATLGMVRDEIERGDIVPLLHEPWMHSSWAVARLRKRTMSPAMTAFVGELERTHAAVLRDEQQLRERFQRTAEPGRSRSGRRQRAAKRR